MSEDIQPGSAPMSPQQPARKPRPLARWLVGALIVVVVLGALFGGFEYLATSHSALATVCGQLSFTRHGLPCDIPLPSDAAFHTTNSSTTPDGYAMTTWIFSTSQTADELQRLYTQGLHADGWPCAASGQLATTLVIAGFNKPDRANTLLEVVYDSNAGQLNLNIALIQGAPPPHGATCS